jgi:hypothetical protein
MFSKRVTGVSGEISLEDFWADVDRLKKECGEIKNNPEIFYNEDTYTAYQDFLSFLVNFLSGKKLIGLYNIKRRWVVLTDSGQIHMRLAADNKLVDRKDGFKKLVAGWYGFRCEIIVDNQYSKSKTSRIVVTPKSTQYGGIPSNQRESFESALKILFPKHEVTFEAQEYDYPPQE